MLQDFKKFVTQGNVLDLAVAVIIGAAFGAVITSFVNDILMQVIGIFTGKPSFNDLYFTINNSQIRYGAFLTALVSFLIIAFAIFMVIKAVEKMQNMRGTTEEADDTPSAEELLAEIRDLLRSQSR